MRVKLNLRNNQPISKEVFGQLPDVRPIFLGSLEDLL